MKIKSFFMLGALFLAAGLFFGQLSNPVRFNTQAQTEISNPFVHSVKFMCRALENCTGYEPNHSCWTRYYADLAWNEANCMGDGTLPIDPFCKHDECVPILNGSCTGGCMTAPVITCNTNYVLRSGSCVLKASCTSCQTYNSSTNTCTTNSVSNGSYNASCTLVCNSNAVLVGGSCVLKASCTSCQTYNSSNNTCTTNTVSNGYYNPSTCAITCNSSSFALIGGSCVAKPICNPACSSYNSSTNTCTFGYIANGQYTNASTCAIQCAGGYRLSSDVCYKMFKQTDMIKKC